jgi:hypothetical protein
MSDAPGVVWETEEHEDGAWCLEEHEDGAWCLVADMLHLSVYQTPHGEHRWCVSPLDSEHEPIDSGEAPTSEAAKAAAIECARRVTREQAEALGLPPLAQAVVDAAVREEAARADYAASTGDWPEGRDAWDARCEGTRVAVRAYLAAKGADHE